VAKQPVLGFRQEAEKQGVGGIFWPNLVPNQKACAANPHNTLKLANFGCAGATAVLLEG
jgi:hypothetical protein